MRDKYIGQRELCLEIYQEIYHLRLYRDIQGGYGFIAYQKPWIHSQGSGYADPLTLPPGEFMGIPAQHIRTEPHQFHKFYSPFVSLRS